MIKMDWICKTALWNFDKMANKIFSGLEMEVGTLVYQIDAQYEINAQGRTISKINKRTVWNKRTGYFDIGHWTLLPYQNKGNNMY